MAYACSHPTSCARLATPNPNPNSNPNPNPDPDPILNPDSSPSPNPIQDLEGKYQVVKEQRRAYKREYWDWAVKAHADGSAPPAWVQALPADCGWA